MRSPSHLRPRSADRVIRLQTTAPQNETDASMRPSKQKLFGPFSRKRTACFLTRAACNRHPPCYIDVIKLTYREPPPLERPADADPFHTVTQLARELGITARTIRFYEDKGLIAPQRAGSTRVYTVRDRARMILILRGKRLGFSLREIRDYLDLYGVDHTQSEQLRLLRAAVSKRLDSLRDQSQALEQTIKELEDVQSQAESAFAASQKRRRISA